eukprot:7974326-Pyramimonas_sp.AAC.1
MRFACASARVARALTLMSDAFSRPTSSTAAGRPRPQLATRKRPGRTPSIANPRAVHQKPAI